MSSPDRTSPGRDAVSCGVDIHVAQLCSGLRNGSWLKATGGQDAGRSKTCGVYEISVEDMSVYAGDGKRGGRREWPADDLHGAFAQGEAAQAPRRVSGQATRKLALPTSYAGD